jgi:CRISPR-associated protein Cmr1
MRGCQYASTTKNSIKAKTIPMDRYHWGEGESHGMSRKYASLNACFRITSPMYLAGALHKSTAELRCASLKGALRFWWRALKWTEIASTKSDNAQALVALAEREAQLFGSANAGQGELVLRLHPLAGDMQRSGEDAYKLIEKKPGVKEKPGAKYLGYGVYGSGTQAAVNSRPCLQENLDFTITLYSRDAISSELLDAVKLLGLLGGLGSKARKGYGSLSLSSLSSADNRYRGPATSEEYEAELRRLLHSTYNSRLDCLPPFSAFTARFSRHPALTEMTSDRIVRDHSSVEDRPLTKDSKVVLLFEGDNALDMLDHYGRQMQRYRSWGKGGRVNGELNEENFYEDHDWKHGRFAQGFHPRRVVFGLPHDYGKEARLQVNAEKHDRRASPLFFHIHDYGVGAKPRFAGVATILPAQFLDTNERIKAGGKPVPAHIEYNALHEFLWGYMGHRDSKSTVRYFPNARQMFP